MPLTGLYAGLLCLLYLWITTSVILKRRKHLVAYGSGKRPDLAAAMSAHSNFAAYVPLFLILLASHELSLHGTSSYLLAHSLASLFLLGRIFHAYGLLNLETRVKPVFWGRQLGMFLSLTSLTAMAIERISSFIQELN